MEIRKGYLLTYYLSRDKLWAHVKHDKTKKSRKSLLPFSCPPLFNYSTRKLFPPSFELQNSRTRHFLPLFNTSKLFPPSFELQKSRTRLFSYLCPPLFNTSKLFPPSFELQQSRMRLFSSSEDGKDSDMIEQ